MKSCLRISRQQYVDESETYSQKSMKRAERLNKLSGDGWFHVEGDSDIFISKINTTLSGTAQLVYSIYLGGTHSDNLAGIAVDSGFRHLCCRLDHFSRFPYHQQCIPNYREWDPWIPQ